MDRKSSLVGVRLHQQNERIQKRMIRTVLLASFMVLANAPIPAWSVEVGDTPPNIVGKTPDGREIDLEDSTGRIRIVSFWATWCSPCLKELPILSLMQKRVGIDHMYVIAVNLEESRRQYRKALDVMKDYGLEFVHDKRGTIANRYGVEGIPNMFVVDVDGTVAFRYVGYSEEKLGEIIEDINSLIIKNYHKPGG